MDIRSFFGNGAFAKPAEVDWRLSHTFYLKDGVMDYDFFDRYLKDYAPKKLIKIMENYKKEMPDELTQYYCFAWKDGNYTYSEMWFIEEIPIVVPNISGSSPHAMSTCCMHSEYDDDEEHQVEYTIDEICYGGKNTKPFAPNYKIRPILLEAIKKWD